MALGEEPTRVATLSIPGAALDVRGFEIHEALNRPFAVAATALSPDPDLDLDGPIGEAATLLVRHPSGDRRYAGVVRRIVQVDVEPSGLSTYLVEIVPKLWALKHTKRYRVFQGASEVEVARKVLGGFGIEPELRLDPASYPKREIRVQYGESDLAFFVRLLEEAGVSYFFEIGAEEPKLVLTDAPQAARPRTVPYLEELRIHDRPAISSISIDRRLRPGRFALRDRDFRRGWDAPLEASATVGDRLSELEAALERFHYVPGGFLFESSEGDTPVADDRIAARTSLEEASKRAAMRVLAKRADARVVSFATTDYATAPGATLVVEGHPSPELGATRPLLVVATTLVGRHDRLLPMTGEATSALTAYHPPLSVPRPRVRGVETATVVGPAGEEIHTDEFGRVRVHFHWDRESKQDERSSCWLHASQPWAGRGYGGVNLPRAGQEVLVEFVAGDPDRPTIVGRVFTDLQKTPYKLPLDKTQTGWKSNSTGGTGGFNELRFEDKRDDELLAMRAERDLETRVRNDETRAVQNDRQTVVRRNDARRVKRDQTQSVEGNAQKSVSGNADTLVAENTSNYVSSDVRNTTGLGKSEFTGGNRTSDTGAVRSTEVEGIRDVGASRHEYKGGDSNVLIDPTGVKWALGTSSLTVLQDHVELAATRIDLLAKTFSVYAPKIEMTASEIFTVRAGKTKITGGLVSLNGPSLPAARLYEPAPDRVRNGAGTVQIGGPSLASATVVNEDGSLSTGSIDIQGDKEFQGRTLLDLANMAKTPRGGKLLRQLQDPTSGNRVTITDGSYEGSKTEPSFWGWLTGRPSSAKVRYDPTEESTQLPPDAILYDNLRQAQRIREGKGLDPNWLSEEKAYLKDKGWRQYRVDDAGDYENF